MAVDDELEGALAALSSGDAAAALEHALRAWRLVKGPELAKLVDALGPVAASRELPLDTGKEPSQHARWLARAAQKRPAALPLLLDQVLGDGPRVAKERVQALMGGPADPRLARTLAEWLRGGHVRATGRARFYPSVIALLAEQADRATLPVLRAIVAPDNRTTAVRHIGLRQLQSLVEVVAALEKQPAALRLPAGIAARVQTALAAVVTAAQAPPRRRTADLLAEVYAWPDDDEVRLVYADAISEEGDPRGELIVLQCQRARTGEPPSRREQKLLKGYHRAWLGSIEPAVLRDGVWFERGFVAACRYLQARGLDAREAPEWSTVEELDVERQSHSSATGSAGLLLGGTMRSLRHVRGMQVEDLARVARHGAPLEWRRVSVAAWTSQVEALHAVLMTGLPTLPALRAFGTTHHTLDPADWARLLATPTLARVAELDVMVYARFAEQWAVFSEGPLAIERVTMRMGGPVIVVTRTAGALRVLAQLGSAWPEEVARVGRALEAFAPGTVQALRVVAGTGRLDGDLLVRGARRTSIEPLVRAADRLGVPLER